MEKLKTKASQNYRVTALLILAMSAQFVFCQCQQEQVEQKPAEEAVGEVVKPDETKHGEVKPGEATESQDEYEDLSNYDMTLDEEAQYVKEINASRAIKDKFLRSDESPIDPELIELFSELKYFTPDNNFIVNSVFKEFETQDTVDLLTSKGKIRKMIRAGEFLFKINGSGQKLTAYFAIGREQNSFFVPFLDKTNRVSTYKGGRYLDIDRKDVDYYVIDFNEAYNPYCAYNIKYSCPIVPAENTITKEIRAGEKDFVITIKM